MLYNIIPKIIGSESVNTFRIIPYRGCGSLPKGLKANQAADKRALLNQLPKLLVGYSMTFQNCVDDNAIIVVCDLDARDKTAFLSELNRIRESALAATTVSLKVCFCLAVEECEAWLLGDWDAIKEAYPKARINVFRRYVNDSICGTWEMLADVVYSGGSEELKKRGYAAIGTAKCEWAENISQRMNVDSNRSPSFNRFKETLERLKTPDYATTLA